MDAYRSLERLMGMSPAVWRRHANPWSVYTRMSCLPLLALAIWSRVWLGGWALIPVALTLIWIWLNPRAFAEPARLDAWASRGVMGERVWLNHRQDVPDHHRRAAHLLGVLSLPGLTVMIWGLWALWWDWAVFGTALVILPKLWFVDRMVWIYDDWAAQGHTLKED